MGTIGLVGKADTPWALAGALPALAVVAVLGALVFAEPMVGVFGLVGAGSVSATGGYLVIQQREAVTSMQRNLGQRRLETGSTDGVLGAWVASAPGDETTRRHRIAVAIV